MIALWVKLKLKMNVVRSFPVVRMTKQDFKETVLFNLDLACFVGFQEMEIEGRL